MDLQEKGAKSAYIAYIADLHGIEYSGVAGIEFPSRGLEILGVKSLPPDIADIRRRSGTGTRSTPVRGPSPAANRP